MSENAMQPGVADQPVLPRRHLQLLALLVVRERLNITAAARLMGLSGTFTSRLAKRLVDLGYAIRKIDNDDRRIAHVSPTAEGRALDAVMRYRIAENPRRSEFARDRVRGPQQIVAGG